MSAPDWRPLTAADLTVMMLGCIAAAWGCAAFVASVVPWADALTAALAVLEETP